MADRFQGDPKLVLDENGADIIVRGGQPIMDQGLENAVLISLHTREGWCGNVLMREPSQQLGAKYEEALLQPITRTSLNNVRNAAIKALQWLMDSKIASRVEALVKNTTGARIESLILIAPFAGNVLALLDTKNGLNWISQIYDPASEKI